MDGMTVTMSWRSDLIPQKSLGIAASKRPSKQQNVCKSTHPHLHLSLARDQAQEYPSSAYTAH
jgi:hypothetical protein